MNLPFLPAPSTGERGSTVIVIFTVIAIMLTLLFANARTVTTLDRELRLIERRQVQRWKVVAETRRAATAPAPAQDAAAVPTADPAPQSPAGPPPSP